jgi:NADPH:quinone reductase-like Zn-dependent oxidoreductase
MKALIYERFGEPEDVLTLSESDVPEPKPGEVLVRMLMSPVNPSDFNMMRGAYNDAMAKLPWNRGKTGDAMAVDPAGTRPAISLPHVPGGDGVGIVVAAGGGFLAKRLVGRRVVVIPGKLGNWREFTTIPAKQAIAIARDITDEQAAMFFINPVTAVALTRMVLRVPKGAWLLQTAGASQLGRMIIRLGKVFGFKTCNVVRHAKQRDALLALGADAVIATDTQDLTEESARLTGGQGMAFALDCVGGKLGNDVVRCLGIGGKMVVYGTLSGEPLSFLARDLMTPTASIQGFFLPQWLGAQPLLKKITLLKKVERLVRTGVLRSDVGRVFAFDEFQEAIAFSKRSGGKALLRIST